GVASLGCLLAAAVVGVAAYADWFKVVLPVLSQGSFAAPNASLPMAVLRAARAAGVASLDGSVLPTWARAWLVVAQVGGLLAVAVLTRRWTVALRLACALAAAA